MRNSWKQIHLGDACDIINGRNQKAVADPSGAYPIYGSGGIMGFANSYLCKGGTTIIGRKGTINRPLYVEKDFWNVDTAFGLSPKAGIAPRFLFYLCKSINWLKYNKSTTLPSLVKSDLLQIPISLPDLEVQQHIVDELDLLASIVDKKNAQLHDLDSLSQSIFYEMFGDPSSNEKRWPVKSISELFDVGSSKRVFESEWRDSGVPFYRAREIVRLSKGEKLEDPIFIEEALFAEYKQRYGVPKAGDIMVTGVGTLGICYLVKDSDRFYFKDGNTLWFKDKGLCNTRFIKDLYSTDFIKDQIKANAHGATVGTYTIVNAKNTRVIVPPIELQNEYVNKILKIDAQKELINESLKQTHHLVDSRMDYYFNE